VVKEFPFPEPVTKGAGQPKKTYVTCLLLDPTRVTPIVLCCQD
jgi:hypothetical protein